MERYKEHRQSRKSKNNSLPKAIFVQISQKNMSIAKSCHFYDFIIQPTSIFGILLFVLLVNMLKACASFVLQAALGNKMMCSIEPCDCRPHTINSRAGRCVCIKYPKYTWLKRQQQFFFKIKNFGRLFARCYTLCHAK